MENCTKYYPMRRCLNCFAVVENNGNRCSHCNFLFIGEATEEEKEQANIRLTTMHEKAIIDKD